MDLRQGIGFVSLIFILVQGCVVAPPPPQRNGPPAHAPAHGYRSQYRYHYYPEVGVYFDLDRRTYFYLDRGWRSGTRLPHDLFLQLDSPVYLELNVATPYEYYDEHRRAYPPGHVKKNKKKKK